MAYAQFIDYVSFNTKDYKPSTYQKDLLTYAKKIWKMYITGKIFERNKLLPTPQTVKEAFDDYISNVNPKAFNDENYAEVTDDLMTFVDENNIALEKKLSVAEKKLLKPTVH